MRLTSFEQSYTKPTPVTWQAHKTTPKKLQCWNHLLKHNILCEFRNLVNFPIKSGEVKMKMNCYEIIDQLNGGGPSYLITMINCESSGRNHCSHLTFEKCLFKIDLAGIS